MRTANWHVASNFLNYTYFNNSSTLYLDQVWCNLPGKIEFRVPRVLFKSKDTYDFVLHRMIAQHGEESMLRLNGFERHVGWKFSPTRGITLRHEPGVGTFIQLYDTGD